jgi:hypothetical protein
LQDCLQSLLQLGYLSLEVPNLIFLVLIMLLGRIFKGFNVLINVLSELILVLWLLGFN